jgi:hypothetical protein
MQRKQSMLVHWLINPQPWIVLDTGYSDTLDRLFGDSVEPTRTSGGCPRPPIGPAKARWFCSPVPLWTHGGAGHLSEVPLLLFVPARRRIRAL